MFFFLSFFTETSGNHVICDATWKSGMRDTVEECGGPTTVAGELSTEREPYIVCVLSDGVRIITVSVSCG